MNTSIILATAFVAFSLPAFAQSPTNNATILGTETAPSNSAGMPSAGTPAGRIATTGVDMSAPLGQSAFAVPGQAAPAFTADSTTTGTTSR